MTIGLRGRLISTYLILALLGVGGLSIRFGMQQKLQIIDATEHELEIKAYSVAAAIGSPLEKFSDNELAYSDFSRLMGQLANTTEARLTLLTLAGAPIYDSAVDFRQMENQSEKTEVKYALSNTEQHQIRIDPLSGKERLYAAALVQQENKKQGIVQLSVPTAPMQAKIQRAWLTLASSALVIIFAILLASLWMAHYLLNPILQLQTAADNMASGDLEQRVSIKGNDELTKLALTFNNMAMQVKEMLNKQRLFVANASHELRTPLTNIKLRAEALLDGAYSDPTVSDKFLRDIDNEAGRLDALVQNLLTLSRLDAQPELESFGTVSPCALLNDAIQMFKPLAQENGIELLIECAAVSNIRGNREHLHRVFDNLLSNAIKYSPSGSKITLSAADASTDVVFTVRDTGYGIPHQDLSRIFDRFYRIDKARTPSADPGGTGLGLSIVQSIIHAHGGQIDVSSQPGQGTTFIIRLPKPIIA